MARSSYIKSSQSSKPPELLLGSLHAHDAVVWREYERTATWKAILERTFLGSLRPLAMEVWRFAISPLFLLFLVLYCLNVDCIDCVECDTDEWVAMQLATKSTTTTTTTTLSAPRQTVKFKGKGGEFWPFVAKTFDKARAQATSEMRMKGWLKAGDGCERDCASVSSDYTCCFQFFLVGSALSIDDQMDRKEVPNVGTSLEVVFKAEENLDTDVVKVVRTSGLSPERQQASLKNLQDASQIVGRIRYNSGFGIWERLSS